MATRTKTIVRWEPPHETHTERLLTVADFKAIGIFTQKKTLRWASRDASTPNHFFIDLDETEVSNEALAWLESTEAGKGKEHGFRVERQEVEVEEASADESDHSADVTDDVIPSEASADPSASVASGKATRKTGG